MRTRTFMALLLILLCILAVQPLTYAETKIITAEATYIMGDGESPSFAEAMVLRKAKQMALEQAGTYVESYTKVQNYQLTSEEIQTIAGGVLEVEVLEKTRTLMGDGLRFYVKIKATVTTDKVKELAQRIKGKNVAEEYKKLQEEYARLNGEIAYWKELLAKTHLGPEREMALDQMRAREEAYAGVQHMETMFLQRLVSGEELVRQAEAHKKDVDRLIKAIMEDGYLVAIGEVRSEAKPKQEVFLELMVPIRVTVSPVFKPSLDNLAKQLGGVAQFPSRLKVMWRYPTGVLSSTESFEPGSLLQVKDTSDLRSYAFSRLGDYALVLQLAFSDGTARYCSINESFSFILGGDGVLGDGVIPAGIILGFDRGIRKKDSIDDVDSIAFITQKSLTKIRFTVSTYKLKTLVSITGKFADLKDPGYKSAGSCAFIS